ncbi:rubredoxin-like domain-containing protein [Desulfonema limicola]|uniref:Rubredoxin-like domain-containing protein n=1 Tax=Desulfonema limicola TaxID=45656 RepID=A0A975BAK9_9BACT|nr:hypothetical protein [Desulfonema limicola]QTA81813.1 rubredoxin-like domain-containing protein [Desulfonema limicola]
MKKPAIFILTFILMFFPLISNAKEIGFIEEFSLAQDRAEVLKQLTPGTSDYYFYHCLHAQNTGNLAEVEPMIDLWFQYEGSETQQIKEIKNRQALLEYEQNPEKSLDYIKKQLNLDFNHTKTIQTSNTELAHTLDQDLISIPRLTELAFSKYDNLQGIEDAGLDILEPDKIKQNQNNNARLSDLLNRLQKPDFPNLAELVVEDLKNPNSQGFGSRSIHWKMLKEQMEKCMELMPELKNNSDFINTYLTRLAPSYEIDARYNPEEKRAFHKKQWDFVKDLAPSQNSWKVHILYHILDIDRKLGQFDRELFMTYLKLPRNTSYMNQDYLNLNEFQKYVVNMDSNFFNSECFNQVVSDEQLVKDYLSHFFLTDKDYNAYAEYIYEYWLKNVFAETKILNNIGETEQWYSMTGQTFNNAFKERVDIDFCRTNKELFKTDEPVSLDLYIKNVKTLIIKTYEINTLNYYLSNMQEVDINVNLEDMTATWEKTVSYNEPPLHRVKRRFDFPQMDKPGVYIVEFIGNGKSSRAFIQKGKLNFIKRISAAGHAFTIIDENSRKCPNASVYAAGQEYKADKNAVITIPFTTTPGMQRIILKNGDFCSLGDFEHMTEDYILFARFHTSRESLLKKGKSSVIIRPLLTLNDQPVSLSILENICLGIEFVDMEETHSFKEIKNIKLSKNSESVYEFQVPDNLSRIKFSLKADIKNMSQNTKDNLGAFGEFKVNRIDKTLRVKDMFLSHANGKYCLEILGKNGEPFPNFPVSLSFKHRYFRDKVQTNLSTDKNGRIDLGKLENIDKIYAGLPGEITYVSQGDESKNRGEATVAGDIVVEDTEPDCTWYLSKNLCRYPSFINTQAGETVYIPFAGSETAKKRKDFTLLERGWNQWVEDRSDAVKVNKGFLEISGLEPGEYDLFLKKNQEKISISINRGIPVDNYIISEKNIQEMNYKQPLYISSVDMGEEFMTVKLGNVSESARVHVTATYFMPVFDIFENLSLVFPNPYGTPVSQPFSKYLADRSIEDEYRYILDRKYVKKYPGNMLKRPQLLLNPRKAYKTETYADTSLHDKGTEDGSDGWRPIEPAPRSIEPWEGRDIESVSNLDFLKEPSFLLANLKPDENGEIKIDLKKLGNHQQVFLLALDSRNTVYQEISLPQKEILQKDLRMAETFDSGTNLVEQKKIGLFQAGETFSLENNNTSQYRIFDSIDKVYKLFSTPGSNPDLKEFEFIVKWPGLTQKEKQEKYSKYACHELNFFIYHKDRPFFDQTVKPYINNKKNKTFIDKWLVDENLEQYRAFPAFDSLNIIEKILLLKKTSNIDHCSRYVKDRLDIKFHKNTDTYNRLFDSVLKGGSFVAGSLFNEVQWKCRDCGYIPDGLNPPDICPICGVSSDHFRQHIPIPGASYESAAIEPTFDEILQEQDMAAPAPTPTKAYAGESEDNFIIDPAMLDKPMTRGGHPEDQDIEKRDKIRQLFQKSEKTEEWTEQNYYNADSYEASIEVNPFWNDYAKNKPGELFFSNNFIYAAGNFTEIMFALSLLDLPFTPENHEQTVNGAALSIKALSPMLVFYRQIVKAERSEKNIPVTITQSFFKVDDKYDYSDNKNQEKPVKDEFLFRTSYECRLVINNPASETQNLQLFASIPKGAMPLQKGFYYNSVPVNLDPYSTKTFKYYFYFPKPGNFDFYPAQLSKEEKIIASASPQKLNVVTKLAQVDKDSWKYVSQNSSSQDVLKYLETQNINRLDLTMTAFRMKDRDFFLQTIELLRKLPLYDTTLWSYSIYHNEPDIIREYLETSSYLFSGGTTVDSPILKLDPVSRGRYRYLEYKPLINARAHKFGTQRNILNDRFYEQYNRFMTKLSYQPELKQDDFIELTYYMLIQDRVTEAFEYFEKIDPQATDLKIQYDYLKLYIDFYKKDIKSAESIAKKYENYPVVKWRKMFQSALAQLDEIQGKKTGIVDKEDRNQRMDKMAQSEPGFDFRIESRAVAINYRNIDSFRISYYPMDIELVFSRNPFEQKHDKRFSFVSPTRFDIIKLPQDQDSFNLDLPEEFHNTNLMIEINAKGIKQSRFYYSNSLVVQVMENYGHLDVIAQDTGQPLAETYVKVYAKMKNGEIMFYKDGYTDMRGRFDYLSLSTDEIYNVEKLALLVLSEKNGAVVREVNPPGHFSSKSF